MLHKEGVKCDIAHFATKKYVYFGIKLDAEISIWMQSGYDGYDFSATLPVHPVSESSVTKGRRRTDGQMISLCLILEFYI